MKHVKMHQTSKLSFELAQAIWANQKQEFFLLKIGLKAAVWNKT